MAEEKLNAFYYFDDKTIKRVIYSFDQLIRQNDRRKKFGGLYLSIYGQVKKVDDILVQEKDGNIVSADEYIASHQAVSKTVQRITTKKSTTKATGKTSK